MATNNTRNLKVNDTISITYNDGNVKNIVVSRVEPKSWYQGGIRRSYGTLESWFKNVGDIVKCEII